MPTNMIGMSIHPAVAVNPGVLAGKTSFCWPSPALRFRSAPTAAIILFNFAGTGAGFDALPKLLGCRGRASA